MKKPTMNKQERIEMVRAMEKLARAINNEDIFDSWLTFGVADGDIDETTKDEELEYYVDDETFAELMGTFLWCMKDAHRDGGLYVDGVVSK